MTTVLLTPGDPAPWFITPSPNNPRYHFDSVVGRYIALYFFGSAGNQAIGQMLAALRQRGDVLPFLYDESGAKLREADLEYLADDRLCDDVKRSIANAAASSRDLQTS